MLWDGIQGLAGEDVATIRTPVAKNSVEEQVVAGVPMNAYQRASRLRFGESGSGLNEEKVAGEIIKGLVAGRGVGGGHGMMAGGLLDNVSGEPAALHEVEAWLTKGLLSELSIGDVTPVRLIDPRSKTTTG